MKGFLNIDDDNDIDNNNNNNIIINHNKDNNDNIRIISKLSPNPKNQLIPISIPYTLFRNRERNHTGRSQLPIDDKISNVYLNDISIKQSYYYNETLAESNIPSKLLNDSIFDSLSKKQNSKIQQSSTLIGCSHDREPLVVHVAGDNMNELILRKASNLVPGSINTLGYTLSLGNSDSISDLIMCGTSRWGTCSNILAVSELTSKLTYIRTAALDDYASQSQTTSKYILEPIKQYDMPSQINNVCHSSNYVGSIILCDNGDLYDWKPNEGVVRVCNLGLKEFDHQPVIYSSLHPMLNYIAVGSNAYLYDVRKKFSLSSCHFLALNNVIAVGAQTPVITSLCQHSSSANHLLISSANDPTVSFVDNRYAGRVIAHRPIPISHTTLKCYSSQMLGSKVDGHIFVGGNPKCRQILMHSIESSSDIDLEKEKLGSLQWNFLQAGAVAAKDLVRWTSFGFPVVDRSDKQSLSGFDLVYSCRNDDPGNEDFTLLLQQSSMGDVFSQEVKYVNESKGTFDNTLNKDLPPIQLNLPCGVRGNSFIKSKQKIKREDLNSKIGDTLYDNDLISHEYPASSSVFTPLNDETVLKAFYCLDIKPESLRLHDDETTLDPEVTHIVNDAKTIENVMNQFQNLLIQELDKCSMTLWELFRYLYEINSKKVNLDILQLCLFLRRKVPHLIIESILPLSDVTYRNYILSDQTRDNITDKYRVQDTGSHYYKYKKEASDQLNSDACSCCEILLLNDLFELTPCGNSGCIIPHVLIYKTIRTGKILTPDIAEQSEQISDVTLEFIENLENEW